MEESGPELTYLSDGTDYRDDNEDEAGLAGDENEAEEEDPKAKAARLKRGKNAQVGMTAASLRSTNEDEFR